MNTSPKTKASVIYIEIHGGIGQGKSYTLNHIKSIVQKFNLDKFCDYYFISEPLDLIRPLLTKYYENNSHALALQASCFVYYFQELNKLHYKFETEKLQYGQAKKPKIVFLDRSLTAGKRVFLPILEAIGAVQELEASVLQSLADELLDVLNIPEKNIYRFVLVGSVKQGQKNIYHRGRVAEEKLSLNYLQRISEMHYNWASLLDSQPHSQKMVFCRSQNELLMKIVKILARQHPVPTKINWYIASKPPSDIGPSPSRRQTIKIDEPTRAGPQTEISSELKTSPLRSVLMAKMSAQEDAAVTEMSKPTLCEAGYTDESYDEVD